MFTSPGSRGGRQSFADGLGGWLFTGTWMGAQTQFQVGAGGSPVQSTANGKAFGCYGNGQNLWFTNNAYGSSAGNQWTISLSGTGVAFLTTSGFNLAGKYIGFASGVNNAPDVFITRSAAATLQLGDVDAASPVAQSTQAQSVAAGTSNTPGTDWTLNGSKGTGTGVGGKIIFKTAPAGSSGSSQNSPVAALTIGTVTIDTAVQQGFPLATLTDGANISWDVRTSQKAKVTLGGNRTMTAVTNASEGTTYTLWVIQDGTGSRTMTWTTSGAGGFDFGATGAPTLTTTASQADLLMFEAMTIGGTLKLRYCGIMKGYA